MDIKTVSFIGCGALGVMYASHMLKTLSHDQIRFIAGSDRLDRYKSAEFYANGVRQSFQFVSADENTQPSDLVIFTVKHYGLDDAIRLAKNHIGENTVILSFLNGISSEQIIGQTYNPVKVIPSVVAGMDATKTGNAVSFSRIGYIAFGRLPHNRQQDLDSLARFLDRVQIRYEIHEDISKTIWWKFMLNIGVNQTSAVLRSSYKLFHECVYAENIMKMAMLEAFGVSKKLNIGLTEKDIGDAIKIVKTLSPDGKTSMLQDIDAKRPTEADIFAGELMKLGRECNVPVPVNTFLYNAIKAMESMY